MSIVHATTAFVDMLNDAQRQRLCYDIDSPEWRTRTNPEFLLNGKGIRLEEITPAQRAEAMSILAQILSPAGYEKAVGAMRINGFLGELVDAPSIMNEYSYNIVLFGEPSTKTP